MTEQHIMVPLIEDDALEELGDMAREHDFRLADEKVDIVRGALDDLNIIKNHPSYMINDTIKIWLKDYDGIVQALDKHIQAKAKVYDLKKHNVCQHKEYNQSVFDMGYNKAIEDVQAIIEGKLS